MDDVLDASFRLPTVIFTVLAVLMLAVWILGMLGVFDITGEGVLDDAFEPVGLGDAPFTVVLSVLALVGWFGSVLAQIYLLDDMSGTALALAAIGVGGGAAAVGVGAAALVAPMFGRIFETAEAPSARELIGRPAEVRSSTVTATSGYADAAWADGPVSRVEVRVPQGGDLADEDLHAGDIVLLVDWDEAANTYYVSRLPADLA